MHTPYAKAAAAELAEIERWRQRRQDDREEVRIFRRQVAACEATRQEDDDDRDR